MTLAKRNITREDILPLAVYAESRKTRRATIADIKRNRRVEVGPFATFYFENYETMWHQVHEMLYIEKGGEDQIQDELTAYNPLVPKGNELIATVMFEINDPVRRAEVLGKLGGVEETVTLRFGGEEVKGVPEADLDRTNAAGKASAVQFIHFPFTAAQIAKFKTPGVQVILGFDHPDYAHMVILREQTRATLAGDFE